MNCKYCGAITNPTDRFCGVCGKQIDPTSQYSNTTQFNNTNVQQNVKSFDNYNYNPNRYNPARNTTQVTQAQQTTFAHSIAISLLVVMLIIFIIIAMIYFSIDRTVVVDANNTSTSNVVVYQPTYQNHTTTPPTVSFYESVYSDDYVYEVEYGVPITFSSFGLQSDTQKYYYNSASNNMVSIYTINGSLGDGDADKYIENMRRKSNF